MGDPVRELWEDSSLHWGLHHSLFLSDRKNLQRENPDMTIGILDTFLNRLDQSRRGEKATEIAASTDESDWRDMAGEANVNWDEILEESGTSQFALHLLHVGLGE